MTVLERLFNLKGNLSRLIMYQMYLFDITKTTKEKNMFIRMTYEKKKHTTLKIHYQFC